MEKSVSNSRFEQLRHLRNSPPVVLSIAGSDNSGGAGVQADLKTFTTLGVYGATAVTAVVAEHPGRVHSIAPLSARVVADQIRLVFEALPVAAVKTGMLLSAPIIRAIARELRAAAPGVPLVLDPVMVASSGTALMKPSAVDAMREKLFPLATLITPNRDEAAHLVGRPIRTLAQLEKAGRELCHTTGKSFLMKGGHLGAGTHAVDLLCQPPRAPKANPCLADVRVRTYRARLLPGIDPHGTGCTYSAAIAAGLANGQPLGQAITKAKRFITCAIRDHLRLGEYVLLNQLPPHSK